MNIYNQMNIMINYIEDHLFEKIEVSDLSKLTGINKTVIKNVFPLFVGCGISEYIRNRRLSVCVEDLKNGDKVIDVALKYGYTCSETFTRAFKKFHGICPKNAIRDNSSFKLFPKAVFSENLINSNIEYNIYYNKKIVLYGLSKKIEFDSRNKMIELFWRKVKDKYPIFNNMVRYGTLIKEDKSFNYYCLIDKKVDGFLKVEFPKSNYISFKMFSFASVDITKQIIKSCSEYLSSLKFNKNDIPIIERYFDDYVELLIAIK